MESDGQSLSVQKQQPNTKLRYTWDMYIYWYDVCKHILHSSNTSKAMLQGGTKLEKLQDIRGEVGLDTQLEQRIAYKSAASILGSLCVLLGQGPNQAAKTPAIASPGLVRRPSRRYIFSAFCRPLPSQYAGSKHRNLCLGWFGSARQ